MPDYDIITPRLGLRNWTKNDAVAYHVLCNDSEVMRYFPFLLSMNQVNDFIVRMQRGYSKNGYCYFAADLIETGQFIGFIGISYQDFESDYTPNVDIGWRLSREHWNKGLATEGAQACLDAAKDNWNIDTVYSFASLANEGSIRVMQKIGMKQVGTFVHPKIIDYPAISECVVYKNI
ncbi:MAG: GNAT family N-acetyltransferase [Gilvibacter sp.]